MNHASHTETIFARTFERAQRIPYDQKWENHKGYFSNAVIGEAAPVIEHGEVVSSISETGRRIIIIGTRFGNVVIFDRYANNEVGIFVSNATMFVRMTFGFPSGVIDTQTMYNMASYSHNIGRKIESVC